VRIYSETELKAKLRNAGLTVTGSHHAHALHSPYWWLKCAVGPRRDDSKAVNAYKKFLEWDIIKGPKSTRLAERVLSPVLGKSLAVYGTKPLRAAERSAVTNTGGAMPTYAVPTSSVPSSSMPSSSMPSSSMAAG